ncbi:carbamoyltransferase HypF [Epibacterium sp. SM1979]|uniref:Carbamoyltransferase HypF n=1 Tax=Tritonibacter litoralis TaxID=2662264 RepID=A0A843YCR5_9RHOB|nr:carbamoyltransferase HypF [Tritonibacter litoralis]MQQ07274.1 carbamoyltransferase HypF [Tritonibacter litoralis]
MENGRSIRVRGQVQGVGFRPFVWTLARRLGLRGHVLNDPEGVLIHAVGADLDGFEAALIAEAPPLARVDAVESHTLQGDFGPDFRIAASTGTGAETRVTPDAATCPACLAEIRDPKERRFGYAFANCTHCGPRFTILKALPYDREKTTMAPFVLCSDCRSDYEDPADRRFHAQPVACPECGPKLWIEPRTDLDPIAEATRHLKAGRVLAIKGLGGFHLAVDARNAEAIDLLRRRKHRPSKPFALMGALDVVCEYAAPTEQERDLLCSSAAPIVLLERIGAALPDGIAPGQVTLGWMLPYTPLHHILLDAFDGPLVMTSGNLSGEPQVIDNEEAREKLGGFADAFLMHDREIARRLDDSVERITSQGPMVLRRARGRVPGTLPLPPGFEEAPQVAAFGGQMKGAICLIKNGQALLGHHLGELDDALTYDAFLQADADYADLFDHRPEVVAVDLHPEYRATKHGQARADQDGLRLERVQHHHAHLASCLAENGWPLDGGKVAGIILDGTGLGDDGTLWGGEVLLGDYRGFERRAWLKPAPLIGGDMAAREPWRNALVRLDQAGLSDWADELFANKPLAMARMAAERGVNAPMSSSAGRLFDAVAAILGHCADGQSYEGEAAMSLEALARTSSGLRRDSLAIGVPVASMIDGALDPSEMIRHLITMRKAGAELADLAFAFHLWLARCFEGAVTTAIAKTEAKAVVLSGGCFQNALLLELMVGSLHQHDVLLHRQTPANDGGLALGQAVVAAARHI